MNGTQHADGGLDYVELADYARKIPGVRQVWMDGDDFDPRPEIIAREIERSKLKRIVLAGDMPGLHYQAFSSALARSGQDPEDVSLASFCDFGIDNPDLAMALLYCAIHNIPYTDARMNGKKEVLSETLVVGGGIAGIQAALEIADGGHKVYLLEKSGTIGGHMAMFDKTFPTLDCAACILTPKMVEVGQHPNIELITLGELTKVEGEAGSFEVTFLRKARYVDISKCIGCGICSEKCPSNVSSEFDAGTRLRKAIYIPFPQAVPNKYLIDAENCRYLTEEKCGVCQKVCPAGCIDFNDRDEEVKVKVGNIVVATGFQTFDASRIKEYGYGKFPNVLTSLEFERLINAAGPTGGEIRLRTQDKKGNWIFEKDSGEPQKLALIHCIGSRDQNFHSYCSRVCCMYSLKLAHLVKEKLPDAEVSEYYIDMRAFGKGYEEFYDRIRQEGIRMVRGRTAMIKQQNGSLKLRSEDILNDKLVEEEVDMVILAVGLEAKADSRQVADLLRLNVDPSGWFVEVCNSSDPVSTARAGIHLAGACQGPKDIPDAVAQGSAAAANVLQSIVAGKLTESLNGLHDIELRAKELASIREEES